MEKEKQDQPVAHIDPETEERLEQAYGPAFEAPVETVISKEQKERQAHLPGQEP